MDKKNRILLRSSLCAIFLLLVVLSLSAAPLAAQSTQTLCTDSSVMSWDTSGSNTKTFTMTKDCYIKVSGTYGYLTIPTGKTYTINGAGFSIYAADKRRHGNNSGSGTVFTLEGSPYGQGISLTLRNVTIRGGGTARAAAGAPDPAINLGRANLTLDNVTIRDTRGGAIHKFRAGTVTVKNSTFSGNQVSGQGTANWGAAIKMDDGNLVLQNLFTAKNNTGSRGAIYVTSGTASLDIDTLYCLDLAGNQNSGGSASDIYPALTGALKTQWDGVQRKATDNCDATTTPTPTATPVTPTATPVTPTATPVTRPDCRDDASVMSWNPDYTTGATFTMTKDCSTKADGTNIRHLEARNNTTVTIDGGGFTIYAADKSAYNDTGTVIGFESQSGITFTLRNLTIDGGGDAASPTGGDPDPAIVVRNGNLILDNVTIQNTRGGAIRVTGSGSVTIKNSTLNDNRVSGANSANEGAAITMNSGSLTLQELFTAKNNRGGQGAAYVKAAATIDITALTCKDVSGNQNAGGMPSTIAFNTEPAGFQTAWDGKQVKVGGTCQAPATPAPTATAAPSTPTPTTPAPTPGDDVDRLAWALAMADANYGRRIKGTLGLDRSAYYYKDSNGILMLQIYRVDSNSAGHWVMNVSQAAIDAVSGPACVASSPDGRYAVRVWADRNITISDGPGLEGKIFHNTLQGNVKGTLIATQTTYSSTPPGVGCPGYLG